MASFFTLPFLLSCITLLVLLQIPSYLSAYDYYTACSNLYDCGKIRNIGFPFWGAGRPRDCGYPELYLNCSGNSTFITIKSVKYLVLDANPDKLILRIVRFDYMEDLCPEQFISTSLDPQMFEYVRDLKKLTLLYGCPPFPLLNIGLFVCRKNGFDSENGYALLGNIPGSSVLCNASVVVPVEGPLSSVDVLDLGKVQRAVRDGFEVKWIPGIVECDNCQKSEGVCGYNWALRETSCYRKEEFSAPSSETGDATPQGPSGAGSKKRLRIGVGYGY